jgi:hypothetical protein
MEGSPYYVVGQDAYPGSTGAFDPLFLGVVAVLVVLLAVSVLRGKK